MHAGDVSNLAVKSLIVSVLLVAVWWFVVAWVTDDQCMVTNTRWGNISCEEWKERLKAMPAPG